jgi:hypothetical protein
VAKPKPKLAPADAPRTIAHHLDAAAHNLAHGIRHTQVAGNSATGSTKANITQHAEPHLEEARHKLADLAEALSKNHPAVGKEMDKLEGQKAARGKKAK